MEWNGTFRERRRVDGRVGHTSELTERSHGGLDRRNGFLKLVMDVL